MRFPDDFVWGTATSSYQIEGATETDGRGESIWDRFAKSPGKVSDGSDGSRACEHYQRWPEDVELMQWLGIRAYRFSIAWPRIQPQGRGPANESGLDFYSALVDGLLEANITPFVTLYHWDLPQPLEDQGGWPVRSTAEAFVEYSELVSRRLGDRVEHWITHNEPWCAAMLGYATGYHAPGRRSMPDALAAAHHMLLSHGWSVPVIRANAPSARVGITVNLVPAEPASPSEADADATRAFDGSFNRWFLDPLYGRGYPTDVIEDHRTSGHLPAGDLPFLKPGDLECIAAPCDFLGVNYYNRGVVRSEQIPEAENAPRTVQLRPEKTDMDWEVYAPGLETLLRRVHADYPVGKLYVTENGAAYDTAPNSEGRIRDEARIRYLREHFDAALRARSAGVPLCGYFVWSLLDNFEWAEGYMKRFGIVWVDYETQERTPKDSALFYRDLIRSSTTREVAQ